MLKRTTRSIRRPETDDFDGHINMLLNETDEKNREHFNLVQRKLGAIVAKQELDAIPILLSRYIPSDRARYSVTCERFNYMKEGFEHQELEIRSLVDGIALMYTTEAPLELRSHRFIFPEIGQPNYTRSPYFVDGQAISSAHIDLVGVDAISIHPVAVKQVTYVHGALAQLVA